MSEMEMEMEKALTVGEMAKLSDGAQQFLYGVMAGLTAKQERRAAADGNGEHDGAETVPVLRGEAAGGAAV